MNPELGLSCPSCGASQHAGDRFCEQCGARLDEVPEERVGCRACGAPADAIGEDGYCSVCGVRERPGDARIELDLLTAAGVSDPRGHCPGRCHRGARRRVRRWRTVAGVGRKREETDEP